MDVSLADGCDIFEFPINRINDPIPTTGTKYDRIIREAFYAHWQEGLNEFIFRRDEINGQALGLSPKNVGDVIYTFRYRRPLPQDILDRAPLGLIWTIEGAGSGLYRFKAVADCWFDPDPNAQLIRLPDRTPDEILEDGGRDEQAILASVAYNRLLDLFLGCRLERKQSHWRTAVTGIGQIEVDDVYLGTDGHDGKSVVVTVQAKRDKDRVNAVQIIQDIRACNERNDGRRCRPVSVHYDSTTGRFALMEFSETDGSVVVILEKHYMLTKQTVIN